MTSAVLQWIAVATMAVDHLGYRVFPGVDVLRMIGRLSFPIFAFMLMEGFVHTADRRKYVLRLAVFAVVSEWPYQIFARGVWGTLPPWSNILFELLLIFAALLLVEKGRFWRLGAIGIAVLAEMLGCMYGAYGIVLGVGFYMSRNRRWAGLLCLAASTVIYCLYHGSWFQIYAVFAAVPLYFYNGQKGQRLPRYFCYAFYPLHLLAIVGVFWLQRVV